MAAVIFNQSRKVAGKLYPKSKAAQQVPDKVIQGNWFFQGLVKAGDVSLVGAVKKAAPAKDSDAK